MKKWYGAAASFAIAVLVVSMSAVPVLARENDDNSGPGSGSNRPSTVLHRDDGRGTQLDDDKQRAMPVSQEQLQQLRGRAEDNLEKRKAQRQVRTAEEREQRCKVVKQGLQKKVERLGTNAERHLAHIDGVFTKAQTYQTTASVSGEEIDTALAAAQTAQAEATTSVEALKDLQPTIDCNKDSVASDVATFREAAAEARTKLQAYRKAVKTLLVALKDATPATTEDNSSEN